MQYAITAISLALLFVTPAGAQDLPLATDASLPGMPPYAGDIPKPQTVIGHEIGTRHSTSAEVTAYFEKMATASARVQLRRHGHSYEGRPLVHAIVTAPSNMKRLAKIRRHNQMLSADPGSVSAADIEQWPVIVYMGYGVHGDEASTSEAAMLLLYHLAAARGGGVAEMLEQMVILIDPLFNPDGRDRFVDWVNRNRGATPNADPQDREHNQPWPGGRTNHYWFDLNRDWLPAQQPETQGRLQVFHRWRPQVFTDYHEMGKDGTYFFQPGAPSRTHPLTPSRNQQLTAEIATYHKKALDKAGVLFYSKETYDDFYYGKGSTYPDVNGAVGILFEQASSRALKQKTKRGERTYGETIRNQFLTSRSTLRAAQEMREKLLRYMRSFYEGASAWADRQSVSGYVVSLAHERTKAQAMAKMLRRHRVRLYKLKQTLTVGRKRFRPGCAYVVPTSQPQARLVQALMEKRTTFPDSVFYDVSAWTMPLAFGVDYAELHDDPSPYLGKKIRSISFDSGRVIGGKAQYAYILPWKRYYAPRALYSMEKAGLRPRLMEEPFTAVVDGDEYAFDRGSIILPVQQNSIKPADLHRLVRKLARNDYVRIYATDAGETPEGPDMGSNAGKVLKKPDVGLVVGEGTRAYNAGEVWHLLTKRFQMPVSLLNAGNISSMELSRYDVLILAGGSYGTLPSRDIKQWVRNGGRLIAQADAVGWVTQVGLAALSTVTSTATRSQAKNAPYEALPRIYRAQQIKGAIFEVNLDVTHPLAFGFDRHIPVFHRGTTFHKAPSTPGRPAGVYAAHPLLSGYASDENLTAMSGTVALAGLHRGSGSVVLLMENPNLRAFWYGTDGLLLNAVFFGGAF